MYKHKYWLFYKPLNNSSIFFFVLLLLPVPSTSYGNKFPTSVLYLCDTHGHTFKLTQTLGSYIRYTKSHFYNLTAITGRFFPCCYPSLPYFHGSCKYLQLRIAKMLKVKWRNGAVEVWKITSNKEKQKKHETRLLLQ